MEEDSNSEKNIPPVEKTVSPTEGKASVNATPEVSEKPLFSSPKIEALQKEISSWFEGLEFTEEGTEFLTVTCNTIQSRELLTKLRNEKSMDFDYLFCLSGVDMPEYFTVVYHLESTKLGHQLVVKVNTENRENPCVDTVCDIWRTAELHEREAYDLLGIKFNNHPDLRRLFLDKEWVGYPLRKDYVDEVTIISY